ncbi:MAG: GNAT family N-acetyltransferase [Ruminococcaceae bacterium]|nr:GNAT family N-acetyltransferase [Oscillospiraceae bacterium]
MDYKITDCTDDDIKRIYSGLTESNSRKVPELQNGRYFEINKKIADENGAVIAGCTAEVNYRNALHIGMLWVSEEYQKRGLGSRLLKEVEKIAAESGCTLAHLSTFDFQAKDFYIKKGYEVFGTLDNIPEGHCRYYLKKIIG